MHQVSVPAQVPHLTDRADAHRAGRAAGVAILVGAAEEVIAVADRSGAGAAKALLAKAVLPDDLPWIAVDRHAEHQAEFGASGGLRHPC
jgi:pyruvate dehydrogenase (quinone)